MTDVPAKVQDCKLPNGGVVRDAVGGVPLESTLDETFLKVWRDRLDEFRWRGGNASDQKKKVMFSALVEKASRIVQFLSKCDLKSDTVVRYSWISEHIWSIYDKRGDRAIAFQETPCSGESAHSSAKLE